MPSDSTPSSPLSTWETTARSYELDSFGHVNHAVYLNWFEQARFGALEAGGFPPRVLRERGWGIHVVRVEVDYRREVRMGDPVRVHTRVVAVRNSSFSIQQRAARLEGEGEVTVAEAAVVLVWVDSAGRPMRVPDEARQALGGGT